jgi:hypothetical protein
MKKAMAVCVVLLMLSAVAMSAPTTVTLIWDAYGGPGIDLSFYNGDDSFAELLTSGNHFFGDFYGKDSDDNPYSYAVDSGLFQLKAGVDGGGFVEYGVYRTDTKASMYGPAGQVSYSAVGSSDGTASLAQQTTTNYAAQKNCNYGFQANNQFQAAGTAFSVYHYIGNGDGDWASVQVVGSGSASVTYMSDEMGGTSFRFGHGCGCYNNCGATGTGSGTFELKALGANYLTGNGWTAPAGGSYLQQVIYNGGFTVTDPFVDGN